MVASNMKRASRPLTAARGPWAVTPTPPRALLEPRKSSTAEAWSGRSLRRAISHGAGCCCCSSTVVLPLADCARFFGARGLVLPTSGAAGAADDADKDRVGAAAAGMAAAGSTSGATSSASAAAMSSRCSASSSLSGLGLGHFPCLLRHRGLRRLHTLLRPLLLLGAPLLPLARRELGQPALGLALDPALGSQLVAGVHHVQDRVHPFLQQRQKVRRHQRWMVFVWDVLCAIHEPSGQIDRLLDRPIDRRATNHHCTWTQ